MVKLIPNLVGTTAMPRLRKRCSAVETETSIGVAGGGGRGEDHPNAVGTTAMPRLRKGCSDALVMPRVKNALPGRKELPGRKRGTSGASSLTRVVRLRRRLASGKAGRGQHLLPAPLRLAAV